MNFVRLTRSERKAENKLISDKNVLERVLSNLRFNFNQKKINQ